MPVHVSIEGEGVIAAKLREIDARIGNLAPVMDRVGLYMLRSVAKNFQQGGRPNKWPVSRRASSEGGQTMLLSGRLRNSVTYQAAPDHVIIGTKTKYAALMHHGGIVRPVNAKALAIPLNKKARRASETVKSVRDIPGLSFRPSKKPDTIGVLGKGKRGGEFEPWFALRTKSEIPARPFIVVQDEDVAWIKRTVARYVTEGALTGGGA